MGKVRYRVGPRLGSAQTRAASWPAVAVMTLRTSIADSAHTHIGSLREIFEVCARFGYVILIGR